MIVSKNKFIIQNQIAASYLESEKDSLFFDIETTGFFWKTSHLYLIGVSYLKKNCWVIEQWFLDRPAEEIILLKRFSELCMTKKKVIHYNGNGFDLPYLQHKYTFYQIPCPLDQMESMDLYRRIKPFKTLLGLSSGKQKDVERLLNIPREDPFSGKELIQVYKDFLSSNETKLLQFLTRHNAEDIQGLMCILPAIGYSKMTEGHFRIVSANLQGLTLTLTLDLDFPLPLKTDISSEYCRLQLQDDRGILEVYGYQGTMKHFFSDYKNYYYLPLEDQAIHKSVGAYVDKEHRQKANAANCYQKAEGVFFPQLTRRFLPSFHEDYKTLPEYFLFHETLLQDIPVFKEYALDFVSRL